MGRGIEIILEASRAIPDDIKGTRPEIPWRKVAGIGNVMRHDYDASRTASFGAWLWTNSPNSESPSKR